MLRLESTFLDSASGAGYDRLPIPTFGRRMGCTSSMPPNWKKRSRRKPDRRPVALKYRETG